MTGRQWHECPLCRAYRAAPSAAACRRCRDVLPEGLRAALSASWALREAFPGVWSEALATALLWRRHRRGGIR